MPENPGAWLTTTARNRAIDRIRRERTLAAKTKLLELEASEAVEEEMDDTTFPGTDAELIVRRALGAAQIRVHGG